MQPNNPASVIAGLPTNSFGDQAPAPQAPLQYQQPAQQQQQVPQQVDLSQFAVPDLNAQPGPFAPPQQQIPIFGDAEPQQQVNQPWVPGQTAPFQPQQPQYQQPASQEPPAWATELKDMLQAQQQQQAPQQQQGWKPKSWDEVVDKSREAAQEVIQSAEQQRQAQAQAEESRVQEIVQELDNQLNQLGMSGQIPPIVNPADNNDQGRAYRRELLGLANATGSTNLYQLNQNLLAAHQAGTIFDTEKSQFVQVGGAQQQLPGTSMPIGGASSSAGNANSGQALPPLSTLRNQSVSQLMQGLTNETAQYIG